MAGFLIVAKVSHHLKCTGSVGIASNSRDYLFVSGCYNHRIVEFDRNLQFVKSFSSCGTVNDQFCHPRGIVIGAGDNIVVADSKDGKWKQTQFGKKDLMRTDSIFYGMLLYAQQMTEYLPVI
jgi:hypothetical protein